MGYGLSGAARCVLVVGAVFCALAAPARAQDGGPLVPVPAPSDAADANGRFTMTPVADGFLRLDTRTGQVSLCTTSGGQPQCRAGADERAALEAEIDRLAKENARLKADAPPPPKSESAQEDEDRRFDRALDKAERFMRRMLQLFRENGQDRPGPAPSNP
jgi:hypothetical protein